MKWNDSFKLGIASIDAQHMELFNLLNRLQTSLKTGTDQKVFVNTIIALADYTNYHFTEEEAYMRSVGYPKLDHHKKIHEKLISDVKTILVDLKEGKPIKTVSLMRFLYDWICKHIIDEDLNIGRYVHSNQYNQPSITSTAKPTVNKYEGLIAKIESVSKQPEKTAQTEIVLFAKINDILNDYFKLWDFSKIDELSKAISCIEYLTTNSYITERDKKNYNNNLIQKAVSSNVLSSFKDNNAKIRFFMNMRDNNFIASEDYEIFKRDVLS